MREVTEDLVACLPDPFQYRTQADAVEVRRLGELPTQQVDQGGREIGAAGQRVGYRSRRRDAGQNNDLGHADAAFIDSLLPGTQG